MNEPVSRKRSSHRETPVIHGADGCPTPSKTGYETRSDARRVARKFRTRGRRPGSKMVAYLCRCGFFHVGNQPHNARREQMQ
jgi:hypothetical protein